jgi:serum/glucocorticoid-regulated kinase 2
VIKI